jgi:hypothetical protein
MELLVIVGYAAILALVAPFVLPKTDFYGRLVPFSVALASGSLVWLVLTWLGFSYTEAWIWFIAMLVMPVASWFITRYLHRVREAAEATKLAELRLRGKA